MSEAVNVSSVQLPDAFKPYQDAVDLIWNDNMQKDDVNSIASKLSDFCARGILSKMFINRMLQSALITQTKNYHLILQIAEICDNSFTWFYQKIIPNPIIWNDDVETYVTKDFNKEDIGEAAQYGAVKCFKVLVGKFSDFSDDLCVKAITGGNLEIIRILDSRLNFATAENLRTAALNHRNDIVDWILEKDPSLQDEAKIDPIFCLDNMNYQYLVYLIMNDKREFMRFPGRYYLHLEESYSKSFFKALFDLGLDVDFIFFDYSTRCN